MACVLNVKVRERADSDMCRRLVTIVNTHGMGLLESGRISFL